MKTDVNVPTVSTVRYQGNKQKNFENKIVIVGILKATKLIKRDLCQHVTDPEH
jgi:hypothetical protein